MTQESSNPQGGVNNWHRIQYDIVLDFIKDESTLLNLGSGTNFNFEKTLSANKKNMKITSVDLLKPEKLPSYINEFRVLDIERKIKFKEKFDYVTFFELVEHVDKTDVLIKNCFDNLKDDGYLIFTCPNLSSIWGRLELLLGFEPHVLEVSNENPNFGTGFFGKKNNPYGEVLHHLRGFTTRALVEFVEYHGFHVVKLLGTNEKRFLNPLFKLFPFLGPLNILICRKN